MTTVGVQKSYNYAFTDSGSAAELSRSVLADRPIEKWLVAAVKNRLLDVASPFVEAAMKSVPAADGPEYHRKLQFGDPHSEKGGTAWHDSVTTDGHTVNYRFLVEYMKGGRTNRLTQLQVNAYYDTPIDDRRIADLYAWIEVQDGRPTSIRFGGRNGTPLSEMPDNCITFDESGINYTGWRTGPNVKPVYLYRTYDPRLDRFVSTIEHEDGTMPFNDMTAAQVLRIATEALRIIPTEEETAE